jgi:hypothetical protein
MVTVREGHRTRLTRRPRPTTSVMNSVRKRSSLLRGTIREQLAKKGPVERDLQCLLRPSSEFAPRLGQHAERADGMEHSSDAFCVLLVSAIERTPSRRPPKRFKPDDARVRTVRHPVQNSKAVSLHETHTDSLQKTRIPRPGQTVDSAIALGLLAAMDNHTSHHVSQGRPSWTADARLWAEPAA